MPWLKRNLLLVAGGVVALGLLGFAGYFLYAKIQLEQEVTEKLRTQTTELEDLTKQKPHPGNEKVNNIKSAEDQEKELQRFLAEARRAFVLPDYPKALDSGQFKLLLDNTVDELQRAAEKVKVKLPAQYLFTFAAQKPLMAFEAETIEPLSMMLTDIKTICHVIFDAKVLTLDGIRRVAVATQDTPSPSGGPADYWNKKPTTNDLAITTPYEFTFHCFTPELSAVLEGLYGCPQCFIVKNVVVDTAPSSLLEKQPEQPVMPMMPTAGGGMNTYQYWLMMGRYGMRGRYMPQMPPLEQPGVTTPGPGPGGGIRTVLDEKPFRVIMWVDVVRLKGPGEGMEPKAPKRRQPLAEATTPVGRTAAN
jgi:hypothetical protein